MTEDNLHDAFFRLAQCEYRPPLGREYTDPRILATTKRIAIDAARHDAMVRRHELPYFAACRERLDPVARYMRVGSSATDPLQILIANEEAARVQPALDDLDERSRAVVRLRYFEGKSIRSIAMLLKDTKSAINSRLDRARKTLRRCLST